MPYSIELHFNDQSTQQIQRIINKVAEERITSITTEYNIPPHLTLTVYDKLEVNETQEKLESIGNNHRVLDLQLVGIGLFPSKEPPLFLIPKVTTELLTIQRNVCEVFELYQEAQWQDYTLQNWVPHCTVAFNVPQKKVSDAVNTTLNCFQSMVTRIDKIALIEFFPYTVVYSKNLKES